MAGFITGRRLLDLDDASAQVAQQHGAEGSGHGAGQIKDTHTLEWDAIATGVCHVVAMLSQIPFAINHQRVFF
jgi:hypothetical protein